MRKRLLFTTIFLIVMFAGCNKNSEQAVIPTNTPNDVPKIITAAPPTVTLAPVPEPVVTEMPTETPILTETVGEEEPTVLPTSVPTTTPTNTPTPSPVPTATNTPVPTQEAEITTAPVVEPTVTDVPVEEDKPTATPRPTATPKPTATPTPSAPTYRDTQYFGMIDNGCYDKTYYDGKNLDTSNISNSNEKGTISANLNFYRVNKICYGYIKSGVTISVYETMGEWTFVDVRGTKCFVRTDELNEVFESANSGGNGTDATYDVVEMNETMYANRKTDVYAGPGKTYDKIGSLSKDTEILVTGKTTDNKWYRFEYKGKTAFVACVYVTTKSVTEDSDNANSGNTGTNENKNNENTPTPTVTPTVTPTPEVEEPTVSVTEEPTPTPTPEVTYTEAEILAMMEEILRDAGFVEPYDVMTDEERALYPPDAGMGYGDKWITVTSLEDIQTTANGMVTNMTLRGETMFYLESRGIVDGILTVRFYHG